MCFFYAICDGAVGGGHTGLAHVLLMQFFTGYTSKIKVFETCSCDILTTQYDHPRYVKHALDRVNVVFTLFGYWVSERGGLPRDWYPTYLCSLSAYTAQKWKFPKFFFLML